MGHPHAPEAANLNYKPYNEHNMSVIQHLAWFIHSGPCIYIKIMNFLCIENDLSEFACCSDDWMVCLCLMYNRCWSTDIHRIRVNLRARLFNCCWAFKIEGKQDLSQYCFSLFIMEDLNVDFQRGVQRALTPTPFILKDRDGVGVDWFDVWMHCLMMGSTKWRRPLWCLSIGAHEKHHLAPELRVRGCWWIWGSLPSWTVAPLMPHNPFSVTFIFLESATLPCQPALLNLSWPSSTWSTTFYY